MARVGQQAALIQTREQCHSAVCAGGPGACEDVPWQRKPLTRIREQVQARAGPPAPSHEAASEAPCLLALPGPSEAGLPPSSPPERLGREGVPASREVASGAP